MNRNLESAIAILAPIPYLVGKAAAEIYHGVSEMIAERNTQLATEPAPIDPPAAPAN